jgi:hypothetical protein
MNQYNEEKPNYARYRIFKEKQKVPFGERLAEEWERLGVTPKRVANKILNESTEYKENLKQTLKELKP